MDNPPDLLPIAQAIREPKPDINLIRSMIENGIKINEPIHCTNTPLHVAVMEGHVSVTELLLELGANVSVRNEHQETPLDCAARFANENRNEKGEEEIYHIIKLLLEKGADPNEVCRWENTPFHTALEHRSPKVIQLLLDAGASIEMPNVLMESAMQFAALNKDVAVIELILDQGAPIECGNNRLEYSALLVAAERGNAKVCEFLLKRGAMVNKSGRDGLTPLMAAICLNLLRFENEFEVQKLPPKYSYEETVELLLEFGANVDDMIEDHSVLDIAKMEDVSEGVRNSLIRHIVKRQYYMDLTINEYHRQTIERTDFYREYHDKCVREFEGMKATKFYDDMSILQVLMLAPGKVMSRYARNEELATALEENNYENEFPIYFTWLKKTFDAEVARQRSRRAAANILSDIFNFNNQDHLVNEDHLAIRRILNYLEDEDIQLFTIENS